MAIEFQHQSFISLASIHPLVPISFHLLAVRCATILLVGNGNECDGGGCFVGAALEVSPFFQKHY